MTVVAAVMWLALGLVLGVVLFAYVVPHHVLGLRDEMVELQRQRDELAREMGTIGNETGELLEQSRRVLEEMRIEVERPQLEPAELEPAELEPAELERTTYAFYDCAACHVHVMVWAHPGTDLRLPMSFCIYCAEPVSATHDDVDAVEASS